MENNTLTHYGIKGQKWGFRRYQNRDGTLTAAGKKRYAQEMEKLKQEERVLKNKQRTQAQLDKLEAKRRSIEDQKKALSGKTENRKSTDHPDTNAKKRIGDMSDAELNALVNRMRNEKAYKELYRELNQKQVSTGKRFVRAFINGPGKNIIAPAVNEVGKQAVKDALTKMTQQSNNTDNKKK
jgi:hypothetical protein